MLPTPLQRTFSGSVEPNWISIVVLEAKPSLGLGALARRAVPIATLLSFLV
jgi:hypothetical protein